MTTSGVISALGDFLCQYLVAVKAGNPFSLDVRRFLVFGFMGKYVFSIFCCIFCSNTRLLFRYCDPRLVHAPRCLRLQAVPQQGGPLQEERGHDLHRPDLRRRQRQRGLHAAVPPGKCFNARDILFWNEFFCCLE
ncbi:unnamed protein product [Heterosigma akashiwo]